MEASSNLPAGATRSAQCPTHGAFASHHLFGGKVWTKCPACAIEAQRREEVARADAWRQQRLAQSRIPARFVGASFDNFIAQSDAQRHALTVARDFAESFEEHAIKGASLIFGGRPGTGKTHLAAAILRSQLEVFDVHYITAGDLIRAIRSTWRRDSEAREIDLLGSMRQLDLLVVDEIGAQYGSEGEQTVLFDVIDGRYRELQPTILITNHNREGLRACLGDRSFDRLTETHRWVPFDWPSYRPTARKAAL
jgi:DNA replication protein DnaC